MKSIFRTLVLLVIVVMGGFIFVTGAVLLGYSVWQRIVG